MAALRFPIPFPAQIHHSLSSSSSYSPLSLLPSLPALSLRHRASPPKPFTVRMGGGPRTFPGGVSKWQWKRMQKKKAKQLLKARLARERQIYEMRKRAEIRASVSELERPWETVSAVEDCAPTLFSVGADEQLKVLADRFQKPGGFDLWSDRDGPQLFVTPGGEEGFPSARFFPKGVVHSVKPYGRVSDRGEDVVGKIGDGNLGGEEMDENVDLRRRLKDGSGLTGVVGVDGGANLSKRLSRNSGRQGNRSLERLYDANQGSSPSNCRDSGSGRGASGRGNRNRSNFDSRDDESKRRMGSGDKLNDAVKRFDLRQTGGHNNGRGKQKNSRVEGDGVRQDGRGSGLRPRKIPSHSDEVYDMNLLGDGRYAFDSS